MRVASLTLRPIVSVKTVSDDQEPGGAAEEVSSSQDTLELAPEPKKRPRLWLLQG